MIFFPRNYLTEGYRFNYEHSLLSLLEKRGIGFYPYIRLIELIVLFIKTNYNNNLEVSLINVNKDIPSCNIPLAKDLYLTIDNNFQGSFGDYDANHQNLKFNVNDNIFDAAYINLHVIPDENGKFNESRYRLVIAHELVHLRDDYEIRKATLNMKSLKTMFDDKYLDNLKVQQDADRKNPIANIIYRLFIDTEIHALGSLMYVDMYNLYKKHNYKLFRVDAYKDIKETETMLEYKLIRLQYIDLVLHNSNFVNFAIKYFPSWYTKFNNEEKLHKRQEIKQKFNVWFTKIAETHLNDVFRRITKAASMFYDDIEDHPESYTYKKICNEKLMLVIKHNKALYEIFGDNYTLSQYTNEIINIHVKNKYDEYVNINIQYNSCIELPY